MLLSYFTKLILVYETNLRCDAQVFVTQIFIFIFSL